MKTIFKHGLSHSGFEYDLWSGVKNKFEMKKPLVILTKNIIIIIHLFGFCCLCMNHGQSCKHLRREDANGAEQE